MENRELEELKIINKNLMHKFSEKVIEKMELEIELKKAREEIQRLKETANIWASEVVKNYHENGGDLKKAQAITGKTIMMHELYRG